MAENGVFDGTPFHRIIPGFVIQAGDPAGTGSGPGPGYSVDEPPPDDTSYTEGVVAMAKTEAEPPGRSGSQFFVVTVRRRRPAPRLRRRGRGDRGHGGRRGDRGARATRIGSRALRSTS